MMTVMKKRKRRNPFALFSWNPNSEGARTLATALGCLRIRHNGSLFTPTGNRIVINWGSSNLPPLLQTCGKVLNNVFPVRFAQDKLKFFQLMQDTPEEIRPRTVPWTDSKDEAERWLNEGFVVFCRTVLNGHSGSGIVISSTPSELVPAALYTKYIKKKKEYRIHFMGDEAFFVQRKARRRDFENPNWKIMNHDNGFIYAHNEPEVFPDPDVVEQAKRAFKRSGLDFGAVDVIWNSKRKEAYVLEINTAPGLEGLTVEKYANAFNKLTQTEQHQKDQDGRPAIAN